MNGFTISPGIKLDDGTILGRVSDIELFGMFVLQTDKTMLSPEIDGTDNVRPMFGEVQQKAMRANNTGGRLWAIRRKGKEQIAKEMEATRKRVVKHRVEVYTLAQELGLGDSPDSSSDED